MTGTTTVSSIPMSCAQNLFRFFFEDKEGHSDLVRTEPAKRKLFYPTYLPQGYEKISEEDIGIGTDISYRNKDGDVVNLLQIINPDMEESFDMESTKQKFYLVGDCQGYYLDYDGTHVLLWEKKRVFFYKFLFRSIGWSIDGGS